MTRLLSLLYGVACYAVFLATILYAMPFVAGLGVPRHIDLGPAAPPAVAAAIDLALLGLFAVQHSAMARPAFKRRWTRIVPPQLERSTYVLASSLALLLLYWQWRPLPALLWDVQATVPRVALYALSALGWVLVLASTFLINHFELFGLRQVWRHARSRPLDAHGPFVARALYRIVRHPIMLGFLVAFWATPTMSLGHLLFALATTGYILLAVKFLEERDLVALYGDTYREYRRRVPMLLPVRRPAPRVQPPAPGEATVPAARPLRG